MNIPFPNKTDREIFFQTQMGNAGNGGRPNPPTIPLNPPASRPRVNLSKDFAIGGYNNQLESFNFPRFSKTWDDKVYSNNPQEVTRALPAMVTIKTVLVTRRRRGLPIVWSRWAFPGGRRSLTPTIKTTFSSTAALNGCGTTWTT